MKCPAPDELLRLVDEGLYPEQERSVRAHLDQCNTCRGQVDDFRELFSTIAREATYYRDASRRTAILARVQQAGHKRDARRRPFLMLWSMGIAAVVAGSLFLFLPDTNDDGFVARGVRGSSDRWVGIRLFRVSGDGAERVSESLAQDDRLLLSYTNLDPMGFEWLAVVARDHLGQVHWCYPERPEHHEAVAAIPIKSNIAKAEIPESVRLPFAPGPMQFLAVFSKHPLSRGALEHWVRTGEKTPLPEAAVVAMEVMVEVTEDMQ